MPRNNYADIAAELGVDRRTLYRWRLRKDFEHALQLAIRRKVDELTGRAGRHDYRDIDDLVAIFQACGFNVG